MMNNLATMLEKESEEMTKTKFLPVNPYPYAVVTRDDGEAATIMDILPSKVAAANTVDLAAFDVDVTLEDNLDTNTISGKMEWKDVAARGVSSCARSGRRARILKIEDGSTTITSTSTVTVSSTAAATVTFNVALPCTTAGFTFGVPAC
jgi:hypothetical protein